jgi:dTDP-glucose 4,6-dehydratase
MKILISGGAGFIGSHLCDYFIQKKYSVICVDNFITGQKSNIKHLIKNRRFKLINADISQPLKMKCKIDKILHFASPASPKDYLQYPIQTLKSNAFGTYYLLELALKNNAVFLLASSSEVYGDPLQHPQSEKYFGNINTTSPRAVYNESKRFAETLTYTYYKKFNLPVRIARIFNTYGPRMRINDGRIIPNLIHQALTNQPFTCYGKGRQTRSFCYITDMIQGIIKLLESDYTKPVNLGNPDEFSILQLIQTISKLTGTKSRIKNLPLPEDDPQRRKPDTTLAKKYLRWSPKIKLETGLKLTIDWFKLAVKI